MLWFAMRERQGQRAAFIYEVRIDEAFHELENKVQALGGNRLPLHVFGNNHAALEVYKKLGYKTTNVLMAKTLNGEKIL
jgi:hypothetical protein